MDGLAPAAPRTSGSQRALAPGDRPHAPPPVRTAAAPRQCARTPQRSTRLHVPVGLHDLSVCAVTAPGRDARSRTRAPQRWGVARPQAVPQWGHSGAHRSCVAYQGEPRGTYWRSAPVVPDWRSAPVVPTGRERPVYLGEAPPCTYRGEAPAVPTGEKRPVVRGEGPVY